MEKNSGGNTIFIILLLAVVLGGMYWFYLEQDKGVIEGGVELNLPTSE